MTLYIDQVTFDLSDRATSRAARSRVTTDVESRGGRSEGANVTHFGPRIWSGVALGATPRVVGWVDVGEAQRANCAHLRDVFSGFGPVEVRLAAR